MGIGIAIEGIGLYFHARAMRAVENEGAASHYIQCTTFGLTYYARNGLIIFNLLLLSCLLISGLENGVGLLGWVLLVLSASLVALVGRALFYILVVPTTMPGAFFWKNKAFEQHARDIGLAELPQVGVVPDSHY